MMDEQHDQDPLDNLEEEHRRQAEEVEREQLERETSVNLTPADEEMIDLREEGLGQEAIRAAQMANLVDGLKQIVKSPDSSEEARRNALDALRREFGAEWVRREFGE
jgi:hypothetical protein